ncbi:PorP/SprF family type IX secretion system membrane protein [Chitinophaga rhizophila]|uniref:Type IX secretion system membrane protein PorP/SprF n=1 Tax=Chitinophaga rhizophila TaxID=2866212 RepID=A0ABS7GBC9_9BACT|nr:type IX secretion system membrane protein PorP/SprF [Chitinophaga rhizophila]MBW8684983.1 type IX secretion system membrane protein PorP/SprF [Chitinophaga rhizophila]
MRNGALLFICFLLLSCFAQAQQDVQFSQYVFNGLSVNPAYAGYREELYLHSTYRQQWAGFQGAPQTGTIALDGVTDVYSKKVGLGGQVTWDRLGPQESISLYGFYAYRIPLANDSRLCIGLGLGATQYAVDGSSRKYVDADDPALILGKQSTLVPDARFGIYYNTYRTFIGFSMMDLFSAYTGGKIYFGNGTLYSTLRKSRHIYLSGGTVVYLTNDIKLKPSVMIKEDLKGPTNIDFNVFMLLQEKVWLGASYRAGFNLWGKPALETTLQRGNAVSVMAEVFLSDNMRLGYSYDITTNGISRYQRGSHELSIGILFPHNDKVDNARCPRYF